MASGKMKTKGVSEFLCLAKWQVDANTSMVGNHIIS